MLPMPPSLSWFRLAVPVPQVCVSHAVPHVLSTPAPGLGGTQGALSWGLLWPPAGLLVASIALFGGALRSFAGLFLLHHGCTQYGGMPPRSGLRGPVGVESGDAVAPVVNCRPCWSSRNGAAVGSAIAQLPLLESSSSTSIPREPLVPQNMSWITHATATHHERT